MTDPSSDLEKLLGPDRRSVPRPGWQASIVLVIAAFVALGVAILTPRAAPEFDLSTLGFAENVVLASVSSISEKPCDYDPNLQCTVVEFALMEDQEGVIHAQDFSDGDSQPVFTVGESVFVAVNEFEGTTSFQYLDRDRRGLIVAVTLVFSLAVVALARMRGLYALVGLFASLVVLFGFIIPAIVAGRDAVLVALVGGAAIALISLYVTHGTNALTHVSAIGAFGALSLTLLLSWVVVELAKFSGLAEEESFYLLALPDVDLRGLLLAGIVLGTIGALDDVTVTQTSTVWEISAANPDLTSNDLFAAGLRVGRDHIASTVNTLLLAYAGASLPLLILYRLSEQRFGFVVSNEVVAVEIVRTLVGSLGLVAAVPLTTLIASRTATKARAAITPSGEVHL